MQHILVAAGKIVWMDISLPSLNGVPVEQVDLQGQRVLPACYRSADTHFNTWAAPTDWSVALPPVLPAALVAQGTHINRLGRIYITPSKPTPGEVSFGGRTNILIEGLVRL